MKTFTVFLPLLGAAIFALGTFQAQAQLSFNNANSQLSTSAFHSGNVVAVIDMNADGLDDILRLDGGTQMNIELQNRTGGFTNHFLGATGVGSAWGMAVADLDHNGWKDIIIGGGSSGRLCMVSDNGSNPVGTVTAIPGGNFFWQNITIVDINNDGWEDVFGCDDNNYSKLFLNDGAGNIAISNLVDFNPNPGNWTGTNDPNDSGNYGSVWTDFDNDGDMDLFIAKCRQSSTNPADLRRINQLYVNDGNNNYTEDAAAYNMNIGWQTWSASFGDYDNDGDFDMFLTNHDHQCQLFENDGNGMYTEVTSSSMINYSSGSIMQSVFEDFDNDGFVDILMSGSEWKYFKNNGDGTFGNVAGLFANNGMNSYAVGDVNHDGFIDVYASYGDVYVSPTNIDDVLYLNDGNDNHFITFNLEGTISNKGAIGARAHIYGPWGVQIREVRAGESYGNNYSSQLHFGLGTNAVVDSVLITWPSGITTTFGQLAADQFVHVIENQCSVSGNLLTGAPVLCPGQSATLNAANGFSSYEWSTGETTQSITVSTTGSYNVIVTDANGCTGISTTVIVTSNPDETPIVATPADLTFCEGSSVVLTSSVAQGGYAWSTGETTQTISVTQGGTYTVTIQGTCQAYTSSPVVVSMLASPAPNGNGTSINTPQSVTLTANGNNLSWYDVPTGGTALGTGTSFTTPVISSPTTYYVEDVALYPGVISYTGQTDHSGSKYSGNTTSANLEFDVLQPMVLKSVKVYTDSAGERIIEVRNSGNTVVASLNIFIPADTSRINLNFNLPAGTGYSIGTNTAQNQLLFGTNNPWLRRSSTGVSYPYEVNGLVSITSSDQGGSWYYYFYDWEVQEESRECTSSRTPIFVDFVTGIQGTALTNMPSVFPNPTEGNLNINLGDVAGDALSIEMVDVAGRVVLNQSFSNLNNGSTVQLNTESVSKGVYSVRLRSTNGEWSQRIVKQ
jgi:hypothetical protein